MGHARCSQQLRFIQTDRDDTEKIKTDVNGFGSRFYTVVKSFQPIWQSHCSFRSRCWFLPV